MGQNRQSTDTRKQHIYSEPRRVFVGPYFTKKGKRLNAELDEKLHAGQIERDEYDRLQGEISNKYLKNRYITMERPIVKTIIHKKPHYKS